MINQQMLLNMLEQRSHGNPQMLQVLNMVKQGDMKGVESFVRNVCNERGIDPDEMAQKTKQQYGC